MSRGPRKRSYELRIVGPADKPLSAREQAFVAAVLAGSTYQDAALALGAGKSKGSLWARRPHVARALAEGRRGHASEAQEAEARGAGIVEVLQSRCREVAYERR